MAAPGSKVCGRADTQITERQADNENDINKIFKKKKFSEYV